MIKILKNSARWIACFITVEMIIGTLSSSGKSVGTPHITSKGYEFEHFTEQESGKTGSHLDFYDYARTRDDEFTETLKEIWHDYSISRGLSEEPVRHLVRQPVFNPLSLEISSPVNLPIAGITGISDSGGDQPKPFPRIRKPESDAYSHLQGSFVFYGQQIKIQYDKLLTISTTVSVSEDSVSGFWNLFSRSNSNLLVDQLMDYRDRLGLGDWGYFQLVRAAANHIVKSNRWSSDQLTWGLMIRSGFDVRLAFNQSSTTLLFASENTIFDRQFIMIGQKRFYLDHEMKSPLLATCPNPFPDTFGEIDLRFAKSLNFSGKLTVQKFLFVWNKKRYEFAFRVNPELIRFYNDYPKTDPVVYFGAPVSSVLKDDLLRQFFPLLSKMNKAEAASFLQQFLQHQFEYCFVNNKDGISERFAEELIASRSGDDRGKSVLFSGLVRILLRLPVVGALFPGYFSTAICFDESMDGDSYSLKQGKYVIADPTFQNIPLGVMVPEFEGIAAQLLDFPGSGSLLNNQRDVWNLAYKMGAKRGGANQDIIFDKRGRAFITGYFSGKRSSSPFIACFSESKNLQWIRKFEGEVNATSFAITRVNDDEVYIAGIFSGRLDMDGQSIQCNSENKNLFLAQFNQSGELVWMKSIPADSVQNDQLLAYIVKSDRSGNNISLQWINEDARNIENGFVSTNETGLILMGYGNFSSGNSSGRNTSPGIFNEIAKSYESLKENKCSPKVAGICAVLKWLQKPGTEISGTQVQSFIARKIPSYATDFPYVFNSIGRIEQLKNENGIISLKTTDFKSLILNSLRIENGARFISSDCGNGDTYLSVVSGFQNIGNPLILPLNNLLIDCSAGTLILDYDFDHTLKTIALDSGK